MIWSIFNANLCGMASLVCKLFNMKIYLTKDLQYNILITLSNNDFTHTLYDSFTTHDLEFTQTELHVHET